jgi:hypothetical protein
LHQKALGENKIPNLKHQITNKSQISIINDQNNLPNWLSSTCKPGSAGDDVRGRSESGLLVLNFEFGSLEFIWNLFFGAWNFHGLLKIRDLHA